MLDKGKESIGAPMNILKNELYELMRKDFSIFEYIQRYMFDGIRYLDLCDENKEWASIKFWQLLGYNWKDDEHVSLKWQNLAWHLLSPDYPFDQTTRLSHKDNTIIWVRCRGIAIRDSSGKAIRFLA